MAKPTAARIWNWMIDASTVKTDAREPRPSASDQNHRWQTKAATATTATHTTVRVIKSIAITLSRALRIDGCSRSSSLRRIVLISTISRLLSSTADDCSRLRISEVQPKLVLSLDGSSGKFSCTHAHARPLWRTHCASTQSKVERST